MRKASLPHQNSIHSTEGCVKTQAPSALAATMSFGRTPSFRIPERDRVRSGIYRNGCNRLWWVKRKRQDFDCVYVYLRQTHKAVVVDSFPLPHTEKLLHSLVGATLFSKLYLASAYSEALLHPNSHNLKAFLTHDVHFRFNVFTSVRPPHRLPFSAYLSKVPKIPFYIDIIVFRKGRQENITNMAEFEAIKRHHSS